MHNKKIQMKYVNHANTAILQKLCGAQEEVYTKINTIHQSSNDEKQIITYNKKTLQYMNIKINF